MQDMDFPHGNYYLILNLSGQRALRMQQNDPSKYDNSRIIPAEPNPDDNNQLFMIQKIGQKADQYQIVSCPSTFVFDQQSNLIRLKPGKQHTDQLFAMVQAPLSNGKLCYWITTSVKGTRALRLDHQLRYGPFNSEDQSQLFRFEQVSQNNTILNSAIIVNNMSGKALDVPKASKKHGQRIIQWQKNNRWNQRWRFQRRGPGVNIYCIINNLCLDVASNSKRNGAQIIQWYNNGGLNQLFVPEPCGNGLYKFKAYHQQTLYLSVKKQKAQNAAHIQVSNQQNPTMYWRVEGVKP